MAARLLGLGYAVLEHRKKRRVGGPVWGGSGDLRILKVWFINLGFLTYGRGDLTSYEVR